MDWIGLDWMHRVDAVFQADGGENENFCSGDDGCVVAAYCIEIDDSDDTEAAIIFGTACQARNSGDLMYEGYTGSGSTFDEVGVGCIMGSDWQADKSNDTTRVYVGAGGLGCNVTERALL